MNLLVNCSREKRDLSKTQYDLHTITKDLTTETLSQHNVRSSGENEQTTEFVKRVIQVSPVLKTFTGRDANAVDARMNQLYPRVNLTSKQ